MPKIAKDSNKFSPNLHMSLDTLSARKFLVVAVCTIVLCTAVVYSNAIHNDFTSWDDLSLVVENPAIRSLTIDNLIDIFTPKAGKTYQPVRVLSYAIDYSFWQLNPVGYHLGNIILHGLSAVVLYLLLVSILGQIAGTTFRGSSRSIALFAVLLFVVHPVNVEAVTWIASRKYVLLALFYFLSFLLFIKSSEKGKFWLTSYILSVIAYVLALLSSPFGVTLPAMLFSYDYCRYPDKNFLEILQKRLVYYLPYCSLSIIQTVIILNVVSVGRISVVKSHYNNNPFLTLVTMLSSLYDYIRNLVFPLWLNNLYAENTTLIVEKYKVYTALSALIGIFILLYIHLLRRKRLIVFLFGWFFITLLPVSNVIPISTKIADRYLYLPAVGLFLCSSLALRRLTSVKLMKSFGPAVGFVVVVTLISSLSYLTVKRNKVWASTITLWRDSLHKQPHNRTAHLNLGEALSQQGKLQEAIVHFKKALQLRPNYAEAHNNLGSALVQLGQRQGAIAHLEEAIRLIPDFAEAHNNLAVVLARQGEYDKAVEHYLEAIRLEPQSAEAHNNLAVLLLHLGKATDALVHLIKATKLKPDYAEAYNNLGNALAELYRLEEAITSYRSALDIKADYTKAHNNLGVALARLGRFEEAIFHFRKSLQIQPNFNQARLNLNLALEQASQKGGKHEPNSGL